MVPPMASRTFAGVALVVCGACAGATVASPGNWQLVRQRAAVEEKLPGMPADALEAEEALRKLVKPPSLCFMEPRMCGADAPPLSLSALRPGERTLDLLDATLRRHETVWPRESALLHCETLCAWRPTAGVACTRRLAELGLLLDPVGRARLAGLMDVLGPHANPLVLGWLSHPDREVRRDMARYLSNRAADDALVVPLTTALNLEPDEETALQLTRALGLLMDPRPITVLLRIAQGTQQPRVRAQAVRSLTWLAHRGLLPVLRTIPQEDLEVKTAVAESRAALMAILDQTPTMVPLELGGAFDFVSSRSGPWVGGLAFLEEFKRNHDRPLLWEVGENLTAAEMTTLLARLTDAGGWGIQAVRTSLATSGGLQHLAPLLEVRRAVHASGVPNRERDASDVTELLQVLRTHHVLKRPTRYWRPAPAAGEGDALKFYP